MANSYLELLLQYEPRPIQSKSDCDRALAIIDELLEKPQLNADQHAILELFGVMVEAFEEAHDAAPEIAPNQMLQHLMDAHHLSGVELANLTQITKSTISEILSGKRQISRRNLSRLTEFFSVGPNVFLQGVAPPVAAVRPRALQERQREIQHQFGVSPRKGLALLHQDHAEHLAAECAAACKSGLNADECQDAYSELMLALVRRVREHELDPIRNPLPEDILSYAFATARKCGARILDQELRRTRCQSEVEWTTLASEVTNLTRQEIDDLREIVLRGLAPDLQFVIEEYFFGCTRPSLRELSRQTGLSRPKVAATLERGSRLLKSQLAG